MEVKLTNYYKRALLNGIFGTKRSENKPDQLNNIDHNEVKNFDLENQILELSPFFGKIKDFKIKQFGLWNVVWGQSQYNRNFIGVIFKMEKLARLWLDVFDYETGNERSIGEILFLSIDKNGGIHFLEKRNNKIFYVKLNDVISDVAFNQKIYVFGQKELATKGSIHYDNLENYTIDADHEDIQFVNIGLLFHDPIGSRPNQRSILWLHLSVLVSETKEVWRTTITSDPNLYANGVLFGMKEFRIQTKTVEKKLQYCSLGGFKKNDGSSSTSWTQTTTTTKYSVVEKQIQQMVNNPNTFKNISLFYNDKELNFSTLKSTTNKRHEYIQYQSIYYLTYSITGFYKDGSPFNYVDTKASNNQSLWDQDISPNMKLIYDEKHTIISDNLHIFFEMQEKSSGSGVELKKATYSDGSGISSSINPVFDKLLDTFSMAVDNNAYYFACRMKNNNKTTILRYDLFVYKPLYEYVHLENANFANNSKIDLFEIKHKDYPLSIVGVQKFENTTTAIVLFKKNDPNNFYDAIKQNTFLITTSYLTYYLMGIRNQNMLTFGMLNHRNYGKIESFQIAYDGKHNYNDPYFFLPYQSFVEDLNLTRIKSGDFDKNILDFARYRNDIILTTEAGIYELINSPLDQQTATNKTISITAISNSNNESVNFINWEYLKEWNEIKTLNFHYTFNVINKLYDDKELISNEPSSYFSKLAFGKTTDNDFKEIEIDRIKIFSSDGYNQLIKGRDFNPILDLENEYILIEKELRSTKKMVAYEIGNALGKMLVRKEINIPPNQPYNLRVKIYIRSK